jgi:hypothetical protein
MSFVGRAPGYPDLSSAGQGKYTPQIYSQKTLIKFYLTTVFGEIANTDYEGEISKSGDKVIIRTVPDIVIRDYVRGQDLVYETPDSADVELDINRAKYFALKIDSIDKLQNDLNMMDKWTDDGGKQMAIAVDRDILSNIYLDAHASNQGATAGAVSGGYALGTAASPLTVSKDGASSTTPILDLIMDAEAVLSEQNVPEDDERWMILPTWACNLLQKSDLRRADSMGSPANQDVLRNGKLGKLGQFNIYRSNNLYVSGSNTYIPFGHKSAVTFASQIVEQELLPHPTAFGQIFRALKVYGYKVVKPQSLGVIVAHK